MKTCPKCQELNSDNATECFKCHTSLKSAAASGAKKVCPHCGGIYAANVQLCPECHLPLTTYTAVSYTHLRHILHKNRVPL